MRVSSHATLSTFAQLKRTIIVDAEGRAVFDRRRRIGVARCDVFDEKPAALVLNDAPQLALRFDVAGPTAFTVGKVDRSWAPSIKAAAAEAAAGVMSIVPFCWGIDEHSVDLIRAVLLVSAGSIVPIVIQYVCQSAT